MPLDRLIREAIFDQADISRMVSAYQAALELTGLQDQTNPVKELIAKKVIEVTRAGERPPPRRFVPEF
jgi:hypothetical protein